MIAILGAGAFGTALACALSARGPVALWGRDAQAIRDMAMRRENARHLPGMTLPEGVAPVTDLPQAPITLIALPMQQIAPFLRTHPLRGDLVACAKGVDLTTGLGPVATIRAACPDAGAVAMLTGPSFAADIARGLPTALTLACANETGGEALQEALSTPSLRLYRTTDVTGAELGGALKNVAAIAAGIAIGAGLGDSARAAILTRSYAEMTRLALAMGARAETMAGLSGLGDLVLTCTSDKSRNFRFGISLGAGQGFDPAVTVEGAATARAVARIAQARGIDMPVTETLAAVLDHNLTIPDAIRALLTRPLKEE